MKNNTKSLVEGLCLTALVAGVSIIDAPAKNKEVRRPNVLFIAVDDLRPQLNCYGHSQMITPNFDKIAGQGVVFTNHHVQMAVSIPSRVAMITGLRPNTTRQLFGTLVYNQTTPGAITMGEHFQDNGYYTAYRGKIVHGEYPEGRIRYGLNEETYPSDWTDSYVEPVNRDLWDNGPSDLRPCVESSDKPDSLFLDGKIVKRALKTMENCANSDKPFFLAVGFHKPHTPFSAPKRFWDMYDREEIDLAENNFFPKNMPQQAFNGWADMGRFRETPNPKEMHKAVREGTPFPKMSADSARLLKHGYYACVSWTDYNIGLLLDKLKELNLDENTIIVVWGDHGFHLGEHNMWSKSTNFDMATKSPLIVSVPWMEHKNIKQDELVETVDIFPTLTDLCEIPYPELMEGCSMRDLLEDPSREWKTAAFSMYFRGRGPDMTVGFSMRTKKYRYTEWVKGWSEQRPTKREDYIVVARELYDYSKDPDENNNVVDKSKYGELILELSDRLYAGYAEAGPEGWTPKPFPKDWESKKYEPKWGNTGFETGGFCGWEKANSEVHASVSFDQYYTGTHSLGVYNRQDKSHTVITKIELDPKTNYILSIWVKSKDISSSARLKVSSESGGKTETLLIDTKGVHNNGWTRLQGPVRITDDFSKGNLAVYVELDELSDFFIDEFSIINMTKN